MRISLRALITMKIFHQGDDREASNMEDFLLSLFVTDGTNVTSEQKLVEGKNGNNFFIKIYSSYVVSRLLSGLLR